LDSNILRGKVVLSHYNLVDGEFGLGDDFGFVEGIEIASLPTLHIVQLVQLNGVIQRLLVPGSRRPPHKLRQPPVQWLLPTLESGPRRPSTPRLLPTHSKSTGGTLTGGDTASLTLLAVSGSRGGYNVVEGELDVFDVVNGVSVAGDTFFEVEDFHAECVLG